MAKVKLVIEYDDATQRIGFDTQTDTGKKLNRLEASLILARIIPALIQDYMTKDQGSSSRLIQPGGFRVS